MIKKIYFILFCFLFIPTITSAETQSEQSAIHDYHLQNGLRVIVKEDHRAPVLVSQIWYKVGSSYEKEGITGISHVLEHMMFQGTKNYPQGEFSKIIANNGGQENAGTNFDYTYYYQLLAADKLPVSFKLEADRMQNLNISDKDFAKEIKVVKEERRMRMDSNPQSMTYERLSAAAFIANPYHHLPIGWMNDLNNMTVKDVRAWYHQWYAPNNAVIVVVGDVNPEKVFQLAQQYFGELPTKKLPEIKPQKNVSPLGKRNVVVKLPAKLPWLIMGYNTPSLKTMQEPWKAYALEVLTGILDGGNSARLNKDLIRNKQIASSASAGYDILRRYPALFTLMATPAQGQDLRQVQKALFKQIKRLQTTLVNPDELKRVKAQVIAGKIFAKDSISAQATLLGALASVGLPLSTADDYVKQIKNVTPEQIQAVAKEFLVNKRLTIAKLKPLPINRAANASMPQSSRGNTDVQ